MHLRLGGEASPATKAPKPKEALRDLLYDLIEPYFYIELSF